MPTYLKWLKERYPILKPPGQLAAPVPPKVVHPSIAFAHGPKEFGNRSDSLAHNAGLVHTDSLPDPIVEEPEDDEFGDRNQAVVEKYEEHLGAVLDWPLRRIIRRFGTDVQFKDYLMAVSKLEDIETKRIRNANTRGDLISRSYVQQHIMSLIENLTNRLITDTSRTIASELYDLSKAEISLGEAETRTREIFCALVGDVKEQAVRSIKNAG
jgi:hypothetical protein